MPRAPGRRSAPTIIGRSAGATVRGIAILLPWILCLALGAGGCGATTFRVSVASTLDTLGRPGVEAVAAVGIGTPLDFHHRSQHYLQALGSLGGGWDAATRGGELLARGDVSYIHWASPRLDVRLGAGFGWRDARTELASSSSSAWSLGAHLAVLPTVWENSNSWLVSQIVTGLELRAEALGGARPVGDRGLFSAALVVEANFLAAGD